MRNGTRIISSALLGFFVLSGCAQEKAKTTVSPAPAPVAATPAPAAAPVKAIATVAAATTNSQPEFASLQEKASYSIGMYFGNLLKRENMDVNMDLLISTMKDALAGRELKLTEQQAQETIGVYRQQKQHELAEKNKQDGAAFLAENKTKPGVKTQTVTLADGKTVDFQYKVLIEGAGETPKSNSVVSVNYRGTLINGKEFDNSAKRGGNKPVTFQLGRVIRGWTESLQLMKVGSKWMVFIPSELAYGERSQPTIEPGSTLIFEVELVSTEPPPATSASSQQTTSDIIKVPSAAEMKAGAKVETIKAQDVEKIVTEQRSGTSTNKN